jgi:hypothetical protein
MPVSAHHNRIATFIGHRVEDGITDRNRICRHMLDIGLHPMTGQIGSHADISGIIADITAQDDDLVCGSQNRHRVTYRADAFAPRCPSEQYILAEALLLTHVGDRQNGDTETKAGLSQ